MSQASPFQPTQLELVREGMAVQDETGRRLGRVARVGMGDPQAITTQGSVGPGDGAGVIAAPLASTGGSTGLGGGAPFLGESGDVPDVPEQLANQLRRVGFVELEDSDLEGAARYIPGDRVLDVTDDTVRVQQVSPAAPQPASSPVEPVLRTTLGTPREEPASSRPRPRPELLATAAGAPILVSAAWLYWRRRRQERRLSRRVQRATLDFVADLSEAKRGPLSATVGTGLFFVLLLRLLRRSSRTQAESRSDPADVGSPPEPSAGARPWGSPSGLLASPAPPIALPLLVGLGLWLARRRGRAGNHRPAYVGTPGVQSAAGRDRTRTGELPPDMGIERQTGER